MRKILSLVGLLVCIHTAQGQYTQYINDAIRFSQNFPTITARSMSMGNAFSSLGGDFSSSYTNPAGLGLYRKSEFHLTPGLSYSKTKTSFLGQENEDFKYQFSFGSLGYVGTYISKRDKGLVSASYAIGYSRLNNFNNTTYIRGENELNSLADYFMAGPSGLGINGTDPENLDPFTDRLAFDAYVIDTLPNTNFEYVTYAPLPITQRRIIKTTGGTGEYSFSFGLNFSNVLYVGMGLGIQHLNYEKTIIHSEFDLLDLSDLDLFHYTEKQDVEGTGITMNMGVMVRLLKIMRLGASVHLPTYYRLEEYSINSMYSAFDDGFVPTEENGDIYAESTYEYKLSTPLKLQGGASVQIGKAGILAADIEYIDYSGMRLREKDDYTDFNESNQEIEDGYRSVLNLRVGGEARIDNISFRVGGAYYPSPFASGNLNDDTSYGELTTGLGYRNSNFFFDLGFSALLHEEKYNLYFNNVADITQQKYRFLATIGFRF